MIIIIIIIIIIMTIMSKARANQNRGGVSHDFNISAISTSVTWRMSVTNNEQFGG